MKKKLWEKGIVLGVIILFVGASFMPTIMSKSSFQIKTYQINNGDEEYLTEFQGDEPDLFIIRPENDIYFLDIGIFSEYLNIPHDWFPWIIIFGHITCKAQVINESAFLFIQWDVKGPNDISQSPLIFPPDVNNYSWYCNLSQIFAHITITCNGYLKDGNVITKSVEAWKIDGILFSFLVENPPWL